MFYCEMLIKKLIEIRSLVSKIKYANGETNLQNKTEITYNSTTIELLYY